MFKLLFVFQSTLPMKGATTPVSGFGLEFAVSIHAPNEGSDYGHVFDGRKQTVSIHAPNEGSDLAIADRTRDPNGFNPRSQ